MARPKRKSSPLHAGTGEWLRDNDELALVARLQERLQREHWERGRSHEEIATGTEFILSYLLHDAGKKRIDTARKVAESLTARTKFLTERLGNGWVLGPIEIHVGEETWRVEWPKWPILQRFDTPRASQESPKSGPQERKGEDPKEGGEERSASPSSSWHEDWKRIVGLWDAQTKGRYGPVTDYIDASKKTLTDQGKPHTPENIVEEAIRRAELRAAKAAS